MLLKEKVRQLANKFHPTAIDIRRHLHQNPELSFQEYKTNKFIANKLEEWGISYTIIGTTGLTGTIEGNNPQSKITALRADIDALPIQEANDVSYRSQNDGIMHACGHDVHTTSLLGALYILNELKTEWSGTIKFIFQPGEEKLPGGASILIEEGVLKNPSPTSIIGQHVEPLMEVGKIGIKSGLFMASADEIYVTIKGKGGHGAKPHLCVDTILLAAHMIVALQQIVSRHADPLMPSVLTFGKINSTGGATNIIPDEVKILGTFRTFDETWRATAHQKMKQMAEDLCRSMGGECEFTVAKGYPFLKNDEKMSEAVRTAAEEYLGKENVLDIAARMGGEDFAFYSQQIPACFYRLGVQNPNGTGLHTNVFDIDEKALETSIGLMAWLAMQ